MSHQLPFAAGLCAIDCIILVLWYSTSTPEVVTRTTQQNRVDIPHTVCGSSMKGFYIAMWAYKGLLMGAAANLAVKTWRFADTVRMCICVMQ